MAMGLIRFYQSAISPLFPSCCRFVPSCSEYGRIAVERFGAKRGLWLTAKRIIRCRPGGGYGYDPVPLTWEEAQTSTHASRKPRPGSDASPLPVTVSRKS